MDRRRPVDLTPGFISVGEYGNWLLMSYCLL